ncbi:hypothetical protein [Sulfitobacter sp.]|uniref:hypothetical protein n=1 Tax=Sulfitobacter sp. TaxID=1903071 RepID=UPI003566064B
MSGFRKNLLFGLTFGLLGPIGASAQGLDIQPIGIELAGDGDQLILAAMPVGGQAPVFNSALIESATITRVAVRQTGTLPKPSIILGMIAPGQEEEFGVERLLPATVNQITFALDDLVAREALRAENPDLFRRLVEEGHIDPDPGALNSILQTELKRMNCYRSGVDGAWGRGSRGSVDEYFSQLASVQWDDPSPTNSLFRAIILNGDVACPTPAAAVAAPRATSSAPKSNRTTRQTTTTNRAPAAKKAAPSAKPKMSIGATGVFR